MDALRDARRQYHLLGVYLDREVYEAKPLLFICGGGGELGAEAGEDHYLLHPQTVRLQGLLKEHTRVLLHHRQGHLPNTHEQIPVPIRPFLKVVDAAL